MVNRKRTHGSSISWLIAFTCLGFGYIQYETNKLLDKDAHHSPGDPVPTPLATHSNSKAGGPIEIDKSLSLISETEDAPFGYYEMQDVGNQVTFALVYSRADIAAPKDHLSLL
eukprot:10938270-Ditylum_brightwellii.AAC.1